MRHPILAAHPRPDQGTTPNKADNMTGWQDHLNEDGHAVVSDDPRRAPRPNPLPTTPPAGFAIPENEGAHGMNWVSFAIGALVVAVLLIIFVL